MSDESRRTTTTGDGEAGRRRYHSPLRAEQAAATRQAVLTAARDLFVDQGYAGTTIADVARRARVAVDTVYATVGRKPALMREVLETAISGTDQAVPAEQRDYVIRVRAASTARDKIATYVAGLLEIQDRLAPVFLALRDAASTDPDSAALWAEITGRRARTMRDFAADLRAGRDAAAGSGEPAARPHPRGRGLVPARGRHDLPGRPRPGPARRR